MTIDYVMSLHPMYNDDNVYGVVIMTRVIARVHHRRRKGSVVGEHDGECGARAYNGVWGQSPQRGPGAEPLLKGSGGRSPPKAESILVIGCPTEPANYLAPVRENSMLCYGPLVSELGGPECNGAPNPVIGDLCPPSGSAAYGVHPV